MRAALDEYMARLRRYLPADEIELEPGPGEAAAFSRASAQASVVALEVAGRALSSPDFARLVERLGSRGKGKIAFLVGGADGIPRAVSASADERVSLSTLTLPHRLARLVLVEQLYRAMTILRGEPYAH